MVHERLTRRGGAIEQSWNVSAFPGGDDLRVRVRLHDVARVTPDDRGWAIATRPGCRFHHGRAFWVDAHGEVTPVETTREGNELVHEVPRAVLMSSTYPARLDPIIEAVEGFDLSKPIYEPVADVQQRVSVASDGERFLAVWEDRRFNPNVPVIIGAFSTGPVGTTLTVDDVTGFALTLEGHNLDPAVAYHESSDQFLVAWSTSTGGQRVGRYARVNGAGDVLDAPPIELPTAGTDDEDTHRIAVASGPDGFLLAKELRVVSDDGATLSSRIELVSVDDLGVAHAPLVVGVPPTSVNRRAPTLAHVGSEFLLAWEQDGAGSARSIHLCTVTVAGTGEVSHCSTDSSVTATGVNTHPRLGFHDGPTPATMLVWQQHLGSASQINGAACTGQSCPATVKLAGGTQGGGGVQFFNPTTRPAIAAITPSNMGLPRFVIAFEDVNGLDVRALIASVDSGAISLGPNPPVVMLGTGGGSFGEPAVTFDETQAFVVAVRDRTGFSTQEDVLGVRVDITARDPVAESDVTPIATAAAPQRSAAVAADDGGTSLAVWVASSTGSIEAAIVDASGQASDPSLVLEGARIGADPAVARGASGWLTAWRSGARIWAASVDDDGTVRPHGQVFPTPADDVEVPAVAYAPSTDRFLVVANRVDGSELQGVLLDDGDVTGNLIRITGTAMASPRAAFVGDQFVIVWREGDTIKASVRAPDGAVTDPALAALDIATGSVRSPALAVRDGQALIVWEDSSGIEPSVHGRLLEAGALSAPTLIAEAPAEQPTVADAADGHGFVVVWEDRTFNDTAHLRGAWLRTDSGDIMVHDQPGVWIETADDDQTEPAVTAVGEGRAFVAYSHFDPGRDYFANRMRGRFVYSGDPLGQSCTQGDSCATRLCVDEVCCDRECVACERCNADGSCEPVTNARDDGCAANEICDGEASCKLDAGEACMAASECASGFCVDGVCCEQACDGGCMRCVPPTGRCEIDVCEPFICSEETDRCLERCVDSTDCRDGLQCDASTGSCEVPAALPPAAEGCACDVVSTPRTPTGAELAWLLAAGCAATRRRRRKDAA